MEVSEEETSQEVPEVPPKGDIKEISKIPQIKTPIAESKPELVCPVPPEHVQLFQECCEKYEKGEMSDLDVMIEVATTLKGLKKRE